MFDPFVRPEPPKIIKLKPVEYPDPPEPPIKKKPVVEPEAVLVSGLAFPRERGQKIRDGFGEYCITMAARLNIKYPGIKITVFNFFKGTQELYEIDKKSVLTKSLVKKWGKLNVDNYRYVNWEAPDEEIFEIEKPKNDISGLQDGDKEVFYFVGISEFFGSDKVMKSEYADALDKGKIKEISISIQHVYRYIENLGRSKPGNLKEFHIFSRGGSLEGQPVLVHAFPFYFSGSSEYSAKFVNKDGDSIDFYPANPGEIAIINPADFKGAFSKDSITVLWGSYLARTAADLITSVLKHKNYKKMLSNPEEKLFELNGTPASLEEIGLFIHEQYVSNSYAHKLTEALRHAVYMAPPGTDANTENKITHGKFGIPLMHIFMGEDFGDPKGEDFREILKFYDEVMASEFLDLDPPEINIIEHTSEAI